MRQFTEDIWVEILSNLQVAALIRCRSVCKSWLSIISSTHFIQLHLKKSISSPSHHRIFVPFTYILKSIDCNNLYGDVVAKKLPTPSELPLTFLGTCDGLVCFSDLDNRDISVWNPATRTSKSLNIRCSDGDIWFHWFGRDPNDDEYKLVLGTKSRLGNHIHLIRPYEEDDCVWKSTHKIDENFMFFKLVGTLLNGIVHWIAHHARFDMDRGGHIITSTVFTYDLGRKTIGKIAEPAGMDYFGSIGVLDGCLSAIHRNLRHSETQERVFELWVMKEYGVKESWTKMRVLRGIVGVPSQSFLQLVQVCDNGDLIINVQNHKLVLYNVVEDRCKTLISGGSGKATLYVESLVFPQVSRSKMVKI